MLAASILVIGDEILGGFVHDTNSYFLTQRLHAAAVPVTRVQTVPDDPAAIDEALQQELARARPRLVLTAGGIGSTPDDVTFEAVAASLGRGLVEEPSIARRVEGAIGWQQDRGVAVDDAFRDHMLRMARIPAGAQVVDRPGGWVPAIRIDLDGGIDDPGGATLVILPGLPSELRAITRDVVEPLVSGRNPPQVVREVEHGFPESALNPAFAELGAAHPGVRVGSYPGTPMLVRLVGPAADVERAHARLQAYLADLVSGTAGALEEAWADRVEHVEWQGS